MGRRPDGFWKNLSDEDLREYYGEHFAGWNRARVQKDRAKAGSTFYNEVRVRGLVDEIFPACRYHNWDGFGVAEFKQFYEEHLAGMSRTELQKDVDGLGSAFYSTVARLGLKDEVLPSPQRVRWSSFTEEDFHSYYEERFSGMTVAQVKEVPGGYAFFKALVRRDLISVIFPPRDTRLQREIDFDGFTVEDFKQHYQTHFSGMNRTRVKKAPDGRAFYERLFDLNLLDAVIPLGTRGQFSDFTLENFQAYYEEYYSGLCAYQVMQLESGNAFYLALRKAGFSSADVFAPNSQHSWNEFTLQDFKNYYGDHFAGWHRTRVQKDAPHGRSFYRAVAARGFTDEVFPESLRRPNGYWDDRENVVSEIEPLVFELGRFPKSREIAAFSSSLASSLSRHGGYYAVKAHMGYADSASQKPSGYWKEWDNLEPAMQAEISKLGRFPLKRELPGYLASALVHHDGLIGVKARMGYVSNELAALEELVEVLV